jgi:hypothetical protein
VQAPAGATHFKVVSVGAAIDFDKEQYEEDFRETDYLSLEEPVSETICLEHAPEVQAGQSLLLAMGVVFYVRSEHGHYERMNGGAMRVLQVASPALPLLRDGGEMLAPEVINEQLVFPTAAEKEKTDLTVETQDSYADTCLWCDQLGIIHEQVFDPLLRQVLKEAGG